MRWIASRVLIGSTAYVPHRHFYLLTHLLPNVKYFYNCKLIAKIHLRAEVASISFEQAIGSVGSRTTYRFLEGCSTIDAVLRLRAVAEEAVGCGRLL